MNMLLSLRRQGLPMVDQSHHASEKCFHDWQTTTVSQRQGPSLSELHQPQNLNQKDIHYIKINQILLLCYAASSIDANYHLKQYLPQLYRCDGHKPTTSLIMG